MEMLLHTVLEALEVLYHVDALQLVPLEVLLEVLLEDLEVLLEDLELLLEDLEVILYRVGAVQLVPLLEDFGESQPLLQVLLQQILVCVSVPLLIMLLLDPRPHLHLMDPALANG